MLIEAKISPRDVAFIHPGQNALVKITAYDYSIYGGLKGVVTTISPDTLQDEVKRDLYYYRVYIRTDASQLENREGKSFPIFPGMIATVDIKTGAAGFIEAFYAGVIQQHPAVIFTFFQRHSAGNAQQSDQRIHRVEAG
ncbi:Protein CyaD [Beauveria bassiana D1-5]|uniref:Protein CyaD n=1 Tax=Beauveria bassiana D1-5 TaxID=1245745 RepID=A0A0A2VZC8_BEABA|nr:Protein CyaD [Beauveria bassiana D1-5]